VTEASPTTPLKGAWPTVKNKKKVAWAAGFATVLVAAAVPAFAGPSLPLLDVRPDGLDLSLDIGLGLPGQPAFGGQGPSSSQTPYLVGTAPGVATQSILTTGDSVGGYRMAGIPDGLGAYDNYDGTFTVLMNHEIGSSLGIVRAHGGRGAFVSKLVVDKRTLKVRSGEDLIKRVKRFNATTGAWEPSSALNFSRLCSADLPHDAFFDRASGKGTLGRIFMNGEESGPEGRSLGTVVTGPDAGTTYELASLGKAGWENAVAKPDAGRKTVVAEMDDGSPGPVYLYVGDKKSTGNDVEKAGLTGGRMFAIKIDSVPAESDSTTLPSGNARFGLVDLGDVSGLTGAELKAKALSMGATGMNRPEDGSWDPSDAHNLYFNTTASFGSATAPGITRTWKLRFDKPSDVLAGGVAKIAIAGPAFDPAKTNAQQGGPRMLDNITVNGLGQAIALEDVGGNDYLGGVYLYDPRSGSLSRVAQHDPARFAVNTPPLPTFLTKDEESSGVIPAPFLGPDMYLVDVQAHLPTSDAELVEGGQLLALQIPSWKRF
jgi:hypothetical protein